MIMTRFLLPFALFLALTACSETTRYLVDTPPPEAQSKQRLRVATIELKDVALPGHASGPDVMMQAEDGTMVVLGEADWVDEPVRSYTDLLARELDTRSTATVAAEPWPLFDRAQAEIVVRIDRMLARADGQMELSAQVAVTSSDRVIADRIERFVLTTPMPSLDARGVSAASGTVLQMLAGRILTMLAR
jgi:uncharacterized lipoprotein YmbA